MLRRARLVVVLAVAAWLAPASGCAGSRPAGDALLDVWSGLDHALASIDGRVPDICGVTYGTWFADFGVRGLACLAEQVVPAPALVVRAPAAPFRHGPHVATGSDVRLDLNATRDFGHYDPAFVRWLAGAAVPRASAAVTLTRPVYERRVARLARVYWLTRGDLAAGGYPARVPAGTPAAYAAFLDGGPVPEGARYGDGFAVFAFSDLSETVAPRLGMAVGNPWEVTYEANTAYGFWLRRRADGTEALWHDGLRTLLARYDGAWLAAHGG